MTRLMSQSLAHTWKPGAPKGPKSWERASGRYVPVHGGARTGQNCGTTAKETRHRPLLCNNFGHFDPSKLSMVLICRWDIFVVLLTCLFTIQKIMHFPFNYWYNSLKNCILISLNRRLLCEKSGSDSKIVTYFTSHPLSISSMTL